MRAPNPVGPAPSPTYWQKIRLLDRDVRLYLLAHALRGFSREGMQAVLLNLYLLRLDYGPEFIGLMNAVHALAFAASCLPAGALGSRWGSRRMMITGLVVMAFGYALLPLAQYMPPSWRTPWLLINALVPAFGGTLFNVNGVPFLIGKTAPEERSYAFSLQMAVGLLASFVGSVVAGVLPSLLAIVLGNSPQDPAPFGYSFLVPSILLIPGSVALMATREIQAVPARRRTNHSGRAPYGSILLMALVVLLGFSASVVSTFYNVYLDESLHASTALIGTVAAGALLLAVPAALLTPLLVARWGQRRTFLIGSSGMALSTLPLALVPHWSAASLGVVIEFVLSAVWIPAFQVYSQGIVPAGWRGAMAGAVMMAAGLGISAMAFGGGYAIAAWGYRSVFLLGGGLTTASALLFWACFRGRRGEPVSHSVTEEPE